MSNYFSGQGKVSLSLRDGSGNPTGFTYLGNCSDFTINFGRGGERYATNGSAGDVLAQQLSGELPVIAMTLDEFPKANLEKATYGQANTIAGATVSNEVVVAALGKSVPLANIGVTAWTSLRNSALSTTYSGLMLSGGQNIGVNGGGSGADYTINMDTGMLDFPASGSAITDTQSLRASYVFQSHDKVGAFTTAQPFFYLRFDGWNTAVNPRAPCVVEAYKVKLMPADGYPVIGDKFAAMLWTAFVDYDELRTPTQADGNLLRIRKV